MRISARTGLIFYFLVLTPFTLLTSLPFHTSIPGARAASPPIVDVTILVASASDDLDVLGSGECRILSTATTSSGSTHQTWPNSGSANCDDRCDFFCTKKQFNLYPNFVIFPGAPVTGGLSFHIEGQEGDGPFGWESYGTIDFVYSDNQLNSLSGCIQRTDTTTGGNAPMTFTTQICVTPAPIANPACLQSGIPPLVRSTYTPMAPGAGTNFTITATAAANPTQPCAGLNNVRIDVLGTALSVPETFTCSQYGEIIPPTLTCTGNFGPLIEGGYVVYQVRASDTTGQISYEPPIVFDAGNPRTHDGWPAPTLLWGTHVENHGTYLTGTSSHDRKNIVFFADGDYASNKATFLGDVKNIIYNGLFANPELSENGPYSMTNPAANSIMVSNLSGISYWVEENNRYRLNLWYVWSDTASQQASIPQSTCGSPSGPCVGNPNIPGCGVFDPCNFSFADSKGVLHTRDLGRDASFRYFTSCWCYTTQNSGNMIPVDLHELGHNLFQLGDEYCCDAPYSSDSPHRNVWDSLTDCVNEAAVATPVSWNSANCREIATLTKHTGHYRADPDPEIMTCMGCTWPGAQYGPTDLNRMEYVFRHMSDPVPSSSFTPLSGGFAQMSDAAYSSSLSSTGTCVSDKTTLTASVKACFPTGVTDPIEVSKIFSIVVDAYPNGTISIVGTRVLFGVSPAPISDVDGHTTILTQAHDGEILTYFGFSNVRADEENGTIPHLIRTVLNFDFRAKAENVTIKTATGTQLFSSALTPTVKSFCQSNPSDPDCSSLPKSAVPIFAGPVSAPLIIVIVPILLFIVIVRILVRRRPRNLLSSPPSIR